MLTCGIRGQVDGIVEQTNPDGVLIVIFTDGSSEQTNLDGTCIKTSADGVQELSTTAPVAANVVVTTMNASPAVVVRGLRKSIMSFENNARIIDITAEDADVDSDDFTIHTDSVSCTNGTVKVLQSSHQLEFQPLPGFTGTSMIKYTIVCNGKAVEREAEVHVTKAYVQESELGLSFQLDVDTEDTGDDEGPDEVTLGLWRVSV